MAQRPIDTKAAERCASIVGAKQKGRRAAAARETAVALPLEEPCETGRKTCVPNCACSSVSESLYGCSSAGRSSHSSCVISRTRSR